MSDLWEPYRPSDAQPWDLQRVVHLHRCAGFAATWPEIQRDLRDGPDAAADRLLRGDSRIDGIRENFEQLSPQIADAAVISGDPERLRAWWLLRMLFSPDALGERLTLMWHNHFATSDFKVRDLAAMRRQNQTFRKLARAPFGQLLAAMLLDPALLIWLDAPSNRGGEPNENLSRELMELFTLGVGNFGESDVKEAARVLTGLSVSEGEFRYRPQWHDERQKTILGQQGPFDSEDLRRILLAHPATAHRLAWRICRTFLGEGTSNEAAIKELAVGLRERDLDVHWAVRTVLQSNLFFSDANIGTRVIGPAEFIVGAVRALELFDPPPSTLVLAEWCRRMGQDLFYPPNVGGWPEGRSWLSTRTIVARANFAAALAHGELALSTSPPDFVSLPQRAGRPAEFPRTMEFFNDLILGGRLSAVRLNEIQSGTRGADRVAQAVALLIASPEAQLI